MLKQLIKRFFRVTYLHHLAAYLQDVRRSVIRLLGYGAIPFKINADVRFQIDIAARAPFSMFISNDRDMIKEMNAFAQLVKGKKCFLDIGSHYGIYSLTFASLNPDGKAYAIDPSPKCFEILERNMRLNPQMNISIDNVALGREQGEIMMHYEWVHLIGDHSGNSNGSSVNVTTLDQFVENRSIAPDIIKIDVDGFEGPVIEGGLKFLTEKHPIIFLELHGQWIERYGYTASGIYQSLKKIGYRFLDLDLNLLDKPEESFDVFAKRIICQKV